MDSIGTVLGIVKTFDTPSTYSIRGAKRSMQPRSACDVCYRDGELVRSTPDMLQFTCARGHVWVTTWKRALAHASFLARFQNGAEPQARVL